MTSTEFNIGMNNDERSSSRVLKPPGGGHTNIFGESNVKVNSPRPKYDQQNSSNLNFCMNTPDPNLLVEQAKHHAVEAPQAPPPKPVESKPAREQAPARDNNITGNGTATPYEQAPQSRGNRVPPGGYSSGGFW